MDSSCRRPSNTTPQHKAAVRAHCRRVAAWSAELARAWNMSPEQQTALEQAALAHHLPPLLLRNSSRERLLRDLLIPGAGSSDHLVSSVAEILAAYHAASAVMTRASARKLATILEMANALDEHFEWETLVPGNGPMNPAAETALECLRVAARSDLYSVISKLPSLPAIAQRSMRFLSTGDSGLADMESAAASDHNVAAHMIRTANSCAGAPGHGITTLSGAIGRLGGRAATRVLCAASLRPVFAAPDLRPVWNHSLDVAQRAEELAANSGQADPKDAFLAGLMHDIGRLPMTQFPTEFQARYERVLQRGCEPVLIETALCGFSHAVAGATVMREWSFPCVLVEAVEFHHQPQGTGSKLAALLNVAEESLHAVEDLPSQLRRQAACESLHLREEALRGTTLTGPLDALKFEL